MNIIRMMAAAFIFLAFLVMPPFIWLILSSKVRKQLSTFALSTMATTGPKKSQDAETPKSSFATSDLQKADLPKSEPVAALLEAADAAAKGYEILMQHEKIANPLVEKLVEDLTDFGTIQAVGFNIAARAAACLWKHIPEGHEHKDMKTYKAMYLRMAKSTFEVYLNENGENRETE